jgi:hypothetical protein
VISRTDAHFWECFNVLEKYRLWQRDSFHSSLHFKQLKKNVWSVRINQNYRSLGRRKGALIVWFWIGTHSDYDKLVKHASSCFKPVRQY